MRRSRLPALLGTLALIAAACAPATTTSPPAASKPLQEVRIGMAFIPNVQFAPFYVADDKGYFTAEGIKPVYDYGFEQDVVALTAQDQLLFTNAGGPTAIIARSHDVPVQYFIKEYQTLPIAVFGLKDKGVTRVQDLKGKTVGQPMPSGETFIGFAVMMRKAGLKESDLQLTTVGFTQVESVLSNKVDAAVGYSVNEPLQLRGQGKDIFEIDLKDVAPEVAGDGIIASETTLRDKPELARAFARAFLKGLGDTIQDPEAAFTTTLKFAPDAGKDETVKKAQHDVLLKVVNEYWKTSGKLGQSDPKLWDQTQSVLKEVGLIDKETDMSKAVTNNYLPN
jgi:putative riboflavin transport system substrate-binding protein